MNDQPVIGPHILVVDDSPTERHVLSQWLKKHGFGVSLAVDGNQAIELAKSVNPALILMDIVMPGMNGLQATRKLNRDPSTRHIPVVMVSSKDQEIDRLWSIRQGAADYMVKPVIEGELISKIQNIIDGTGQPQHRSA